MLINLEYMKETGKFHQKFIFNICEYMANFMGVGIPNNYHHIALWLTKLPSSKSEQAKKFV